MGSAGGLIVGLVVVGGALTLAVSGPMPDRIAVCDRDYGKDATERRVSPADIAAAMSGGPTPVLIESALRPWLPMPCPEGACARVTQPDPCATVIWVRIDANAYVGYALEGGP